MNLVDWTESKTYSNSIIKGSLKLVYESTKDSMVSMLGTVQLWWEDLESFLDFRY